VITIQIFFIVEIFLCTDFTIILFIRIIVRLWRKRAVFHKCHELFIQTAKKFDKILINFIC